jgi:hypothetical protein
VKNNLARRARSAIAAVIGVSLAMGIVLAVPQASWASGPYDGVPDWNEFVLYKDINFTGGIWDSPYDNVGNYTINDWVGTSQVINDQASSSSNYKSVPVCAFKDAWELGPNLRHLAYPQNPGGGVSWSYSYVGSSFNDVFSSHSVTGQNHCP